MTIRAHTEKRARTYLEVTGELLKQIFQTQRPADRILRSYFREHKKHGSNDRSIIANTVFATFRWWGWLKQLPIMEGSPEDKESFFSNIHNLTAVALIACWLDEYEEAQELFPYWIHWLGLTSPPSIPKNTGVYQKRELLCSWLNLSTLDIKSIYPSWIWQTITPYTQDIEKVIDVYNRRSPLWIRSQHHPEEELIQALQSYGLNPQPSSLPGAYCLGEPHVNLYLLEPFRQGWFEVQDFSSQVIGWATQAQPGERWWDACAGAGGKSLQLAWMMKNKGRIVASDIRAYKLKDLQRRARRGKFFNISYKPWEKKKIPVQPESFDGVIVDAPCSCSGTWRRNPDAKWTSPPDIVERLSSIQLEILERCWPAVRIGGKLVYATCSITWQENEEVIQRFLQKHPFFSLQKIWHPLHETYTEFLHIFPWEYTCDGSFVVVLRREGNPSSTSNQQTNDFSVSIHEAFSPNPEVKEDCSSC